MAWKWYNIDSYMASVGGEENYYGGVQLMGKDFYAYIKFHKEGPLPNCTAPTQFGQRFYGHMHFEQMPAMVDLLRNEKPIRLGWFAQNPNLFHLMTGKEPVGEGDGLLSEDTQ